MDFHFLVMEKSWKINVEKEGASCITLLPCGEGHICRLLLLSLLLLHTVISYMAMLLLLSCAKSHMLSASRRQPHLLHVSVVDRRQTWSMDKSWRCVTLSGFLHNHIVRCRWNPISCGVHYSGPGLSENDSAVTTDVGEDQNREVGLWGLPLKWNWPP